MGISKCKHGIYWPDGDAIALSCQVCNPDGTGTGAIPVLPRSSGDPLNSNQTDDLTYCATCGNLRTYVTPDCRFCHTIFTAGGPREQALANAHNPGVCPKCSSTVHYATKKLSEWQCAECGTVYPAAKRKL